MGSRYRFDEFSALRVHFEEIKGDDEVLLILCIDFKTSDCDESDDSDFERFSQAWWLKPEKYDEAMHFVCELIGVKAGEVREFGAGWREIERFGDYGMVKSILIDDPSTPESARFPIHGYGALKGFRYQVEHALGKMGALTLNPRAVNQ